MGKCFATCVCVEIAAEDPQMVAEVLINPLEKSRYISDDDHLFQNSELSIDTETIDDQTKH